jgi:excisionase family DNA binding protein
VTQTNKNVPANKRVADRLSGEIMTPSEAADLLRVSRQTVVRLFEQKKIPAQKIGVLWRCKRSEIDKFMSPA